MPRVKMPDGSIVDMPENITPDLAARLKSLQESGSMSSEQEKLASGQPSDVSQFIPGTPKQPETPAEPSLGEKAKGVGEATLSALTGIPASVLATGAGVLKSVTGGKYGTQEGVRMGEETAADIASRLTYEPRTEAGKEYLSKFGKAAQESGIAGIPAGEGALLAQTMGKSAPRVAASQLAERTSPAAKKLASMATPKVSPQTISLARKADAMGIPLRPDMLSDNRLVRMVGEALEKVPMSGAKTEERRVAFNRAIMKTIGADITHTKLTPDVFDQAISKSGKQIGDIASKNSVNLDPQFTNALTTHVQDAAKFETSDVARVVNNYVEELKSKSVNGVIPGEAFRKINTKLGNQMRSTTSGDLKHALGLLQEDMHDALDRNLSTADRLSLSDARKKYAYAKTLEPLVAKSPEGDMSPAALMGAVTATKSQKSAMARGRGGELGEIAKVGQRFLKEQPSSGTAERSLGYGLLGGGAAMHPASAASVYGLANLYNRLGTPLTKKIIK